MKIKKYIVFLKMTLFILLFFLIINLISGYFSQRVRIYIQQKAMLETTNMISSTIQSEVLPNIKLEDLVQTRSNANEIVESIYINTYQVNLILAKTSQSLQEKINNLDNEDLQNLKLPLGIIVSNMFFNDVGPNINIMIRPVGSVFCDIETNFKNYGINNGLLSLDIVVKVQFETIVPLQKNVIDVATHIPLVVQYVQGEVPRYYYYNPGNTYIPNPAETGE